jgi:hypothetical protein
LDKQRICRGSRPSGFTAGFVWAILLLSTVVGCRDARVSSELGLLGDAPMKVVWCRQVRGGTDDFFAKGNNFQLMGFDTADRIGERVILSETGSYHKPLLTSDGERIVFSDIPDETIYVVNWNGTGMQKLASGMAEEVWVDPQTGIEWVYRMDVTVSAQNPVSDLTRFQLDNPTIMESVLSGMPINADHIQLSQDGLRLCVQHPWPVIGMMDLESKQVTDVAKGCWPSMAPDNSYLMWNFDGPHRNLILHDLAKERRWVVNINGAPGIDGFEVYHPRWSNRPRFFCMTGPYRKGLFHGTAEVSVYIGRFNEIMTEVESWVCISDREAADFYPDVWVKPGEGIYSSVDSDHLGEVAPVDHVKDKLVVRARLVEKTPTPTLEEIAPYTQTLVVYSYEVEEVISGTYESDTLLVAHWGIVDRKTKELNLKLKDQVELELEPYENRDELEGERLIMELSDMHYPLFYDLKGK